MKKYSWKYTGSFGDAQKIGEELENIELSGEITNTKVLQFAKNNPNSELYKCFEWDDKIAGENYRLLKASQIISSISFVVEEEPMKKQKIYFSIKSEKQEARKFKNIKDILEDDEDYKALLDKAKDELERCTNNYNDLLKKEDLKEIIFDIYRNI